MKNEDFKGLSQTPPLHGEFDSEAPSLYPGYEKNAEDFEDTGGAKEFDYEDTGELEDIHNTEYLPPSSIIGGVVPDSRQLVNLKAIYATKIEPRLQDIMDWRADGFSLEMISKQLGVSLYQFTLARETFYELYVSLMEATDFSVAKIENAAMQRAMGYYKPEVVRKFAVSKGRKILIEETQKMSWVQDGNMQKFMLSQLKADKYGPKVAQNVTNNTLVVNSETTTAKDLVNRLNKIAGRGSYADDIVTLEDE